MRAIQTQYKGYRFRSRLEARWAVFFDALGIEWVYEPEGYVLSDGTRYLPDFWLPTFGAGMFVEVKPARGDFSKAKRFAEESGWLVWLAEGVPGPSFYMSWGRDGARAFLPESINTGETECRWVAGTKDTHPLMPSQMLPHHPAYLAYQLRFDRWEQAIRAARRARFEFNDKSTVL